MLCWASNDPESSETHTQPTAAQVRPTSRHSFRSLLTSLSHAAQYIDVFRTRLLKTHAPRKVFTPRRDGSLRDSPAQTVKY